MRLTSLATCLLLLVGSTATPSLATDEPIIDVELGDEHGKIITELEIPGSEADPEVVVTATWVDWPGEPPSPEHTWDPDYGWVRFWWGTIPRIEPEGDPTAGGGYCHWTQYVIYTEIIGVGAEWVPAVPNGYQSWIDAGNTPTQCAGTRTIGEAVAADRASVPDQLPRPVPHVQPNNNAVTGLRSYFITERATEDWHSGTHTVSLGHQTVTVKHRAIVESWVDWKDGQPAGPDRADDPWVTGPHREAGTQHPHGKITFTYTDTGDRISGITDWWTIESWVSIGGPWARQGSQTVQLVPVRVPVTVSQAQPVRQS